MKVFTLGRTLDNDIVFNLPQVSRHHVQLVQHDKGDITDNGIKATEALKLVKDVSSIHSDNILRYLQDSSLVQCSLNSYGLGDLALTIANYASYPVSVSWTLNASAITPLYGSGSLSVKGQPGNLRVWNDFRITGENAKFYSATITIKK
jgi:hypothetical protein